METLAATDNTSMERTLSPHEAFNLFVNDSILHLDVCATPAPLLPGAERLDPALPLLEAAEEVLEEAELTAVVQPEKSLHFGQTTSQCYMDFHRAPQLEMINSI